MSLLSRLSPVAAHLPWLIAGYFAAQIAIRVLISPTLGRDEAEQALLTQALAWGYGPQPPLYTWLATGVFAIFGKGVFALSLLKNLLLGSAYLLTYAVARRVSGDRLVAAAAAASLLLIPQIAWESQRALTHSNLVLFAMAFYTYALLRVLDDGRWPHYLLLGVAFACGVLAKFNFPLIAVAMLLAALSMRDFRARILDPRLLLTAAVAALLLWRPLLWIVENMAATMQRAGKLTGVPTDSAVMNAAAGIWELALSTILYLLPLVPIYAALLIRTASDRAPDDAERAYASLLARSVLIALAVCVPLIAAFQVTQIKERWLQPVLYAAPILAALWLSWRASKERLLAVAGIAMVFAILVLAMIPARTVLAPAIGRTNALNSPYDAFAAQIRAAGFETGGILASFNLLGGNLGLQFPDSTVVTPEYPNFALPAGKPLLLVWEVHRETRMPGKLAALYKRVTGRDVPAAAPVVLTARMLHSDSEEMRLGIQILR